MILKKIFPVIYYSFRFFANKLEKKLENLPYYDYCNKFKW